MAPSLIADERIPAWLTFLEVQQHITTEIGKYVNVWNLFEYGGTTRAYLQQKKRDSIDTHLQAPHIFTGIVACQWTSVYALRMRSVNLRTDG